MWEIWQKKEQVDRELEEKPPVIKEKELDLESLHLANSFRGANTTVLKGNQIHEYQEMAAKMKALQNNKYGI